MHPTTAILSYSPANMKMICTISPLTTRIPRDREMQLLNQTPRSREMQIPAVVVPCHLVPFMLTRIHLLLFLILDFPMMSLPSIPDIWTSTFKKANANANHKVTVELNCKKMHLIIGGDLGMIIRRVRFRGSPFRRSRPRHCLLPKILIVKIKPLLHLLPLLSHVNLTPPPLLVLYHTSLY